MKALAVVLVLTLSAGIRTALAETPVSDTQTPSATVDPSEPSTPVPIAGSPTEISATETPAEGTAIPTATVAPLAVTNASLVAELTEDLNANGRVDDSDAPAGPSTVFLWHWETGKGFELATSAGRFSFTDLVAGSYSLRIYWPTGFAQPQGSSELPDLLLAALTVHPDGRITAPDPLPATWPDSQGAPFDVSKDRIILGVPPADILVNRKDPNVSAVVPSSGGSGPRIGTLSVAAELGLRPVRLPGTGGAGGGRSVAPWLLGAAIIAMVVLAVPFARARR